MHITVYPTSTAAPLLSKEYAIKPFKDWESQELRLSIQLVPRSKNFQSRLSKQVS